MLFGPVLSLGNLARTRFTKVAGREVCRQNPRPLNLALRPRPVCAIRYLAREESCLNQNCQRPRFWPRFERRNPARAPTRPHLPLKLLRLRSQSRLRLLHPLHRRRLRLRSLDQRTTSLRRFALKAQKAELQRLPHQMPRRRHLLRSPQARNQVRLPIFWLPSALEKQGQHLRTMRQQSQPRLPRNQRRSLRVAGRSRRLKKC